MSKYLVCKSLPSLILRLLLNYHGSPLINLNMQAESDYFALKDISKDLLGRMLSLLEQSGGE